MYTQSDPSDGRLVTHVLYRESPSGLAVFAVLADGAVVHWPSSAADAPFLPALTSAAQDAAAGTARLIQSPRSRRMGVLRFPDPDDASAPLRFSLVGGGNRELSIPRADRAAIEIADGTPIVTVLRSPSGPREESHFDVYRLGDVTPRQSPMLPLSAVRMSFDGARVAAAFGRAVHLFDAEEPATEVGRARRARGGFALSPDGARVALLQEKSVDVHDGTNRLRSYTLDGTPRMAEFGPGGELAVIDKDTLYLFGPGSDEPLWLLKLTTDESAAGLEYRSVAVRARPPGGPGTPGQLVVAAGRLVVTDPPRRSAPIGAAQASVVAVRENGKPVGQAVVLGELPTRHFGNASPRVEVLFGGGRGWIAERTLDTVELWEITP